MVTFAMPPFRTLLVGLLAAGAGTALAQEKPPLPKSSAGAVGTVVGCSSLANLRLVLAQAKDDPIAAAAVAAETKSDLNCAVLDPAAVAGIVDHLSLNGRAYDCVGLRSSKICHWTIAGAIVPQAAPARPPENAAPTPKPRR